MLIWTSISGISNLIRTTEEKFDVLYLPGVNSWIQNQGVSKAGCRFDHWGEGSFELFGEFSSGQRPNPDRHL